MIINKTKRNANYFIITLAILFSLSSCDSSDDNTIVEPVVDSYGSFTVKMNVNDRDVAYKYWNTTPFTGKGMGYNDNYLVLSDAYGSRTEYDKDKYGDFPGGSVSITINKDEPGLYTIVKEYTYALAHNGFPVTVNNVVYNNLAKISCNIGIIRDNYQDANYEYVGNGIIPNAVRVDRDKDGILHYTIEKEISLQFIGGAYGAGNTSAPKLINITIDNGHHKNNK